MPLRLVLPWCVLAVPCLASERPNMVFILTDDLVWNAPACYGSDLVPTPHIDSLARDGLLFTQAYAEPQCSPTRAALLSGRHPARTNITKVINDNAWPYAPMLTPKVRKTLPAAWPTVADMLREVGYTTGIAGKWHVADGYNVGPLSRRKGGKYFDQYGFDWASEVAEGNHREDKAVDALTDDVLQFIEQHRDGPFFVYLAHYTPHVPLDAPPELIDGQMERGYTRSSSKLCDMNERPTADYVAMIEHLDNSVGRLLKRLDELRLADDTLVVFTSDNGGLNRMVSAEPLLGWKGAPYEGGIRVPLVVRWPAAIEPGRTTDAMMHAMDWFATLAGVVGADVPDEVALDSYSHARLLRGEAQEPRLNLLWHLPQYAPMYAKSPCSVYREGDLKLVHYYGDYFRVEPGDVARNAQPYGELTTGERIELYDLAADPYEQHNLADERPTRVAELMARLQQALGTRDAQLPVPNPDQDPRRWMEEGKDPDR